MKDLNNIDEYRKDYNEWLKKAPIKKIRQLEYTMHFTESNVKVTMSLN